MAHAQFAVRRVYCKLESGHELYFAADSLKVLWIAFGVVRNPECIEVPDHGPPNLAGSGAFDGKQSQHGGVVAQSLPTAPLADRLGHGFGDAGPTLNRERELDHAAIRADDLVPVRCSPFPPDAVDPTRPGVFHGVFLDVTKSSQECVVFTARINGHGLFRPIELHVLGYGYHVGNV